MLGLFRKKSPPPPPSLEQIEAAKRMAALALEHDQRRIAYERLYDKVFHAALDVVCGDYLTDDRGRKRAHEIARFGTRGSNASKRFFTSKDAITDAAFAYAEGRWADVTGPEVLDAT